MHSPLALGSSAPGTYRSNFLQRSLTFAQGLGNVDAVQLEVWIKLNLFLHLINELTKFIPLCLGWPSLFWLRCLTRGWKCGTIFRNTGRLCLRSLKICLHSASTPASVFGNLWFVRLEVCVIKGVLLHLCIGSMTLLSFCLALSSLTVSPTVGLIFVIIFRKARCLRVRDVMFLGGHVSNDLCAADAKWRC